MFEMSSVSCNAGSHYLTVSCTIPSLQDHIYRNQTKDMEDLCQRVQKWGGLDQRVIDSAIKEWHKRLRACVAADRGYFEHTL